jgi:hypothetical protein
VSVEILKPICYLGVSGYLNYFVFSSDEKIKLEQEIQTILFPDTDRIYTDYCKNRGLDSGNSRVWRSWVNKKCDILSLWCQIWYKGDIFVTRDSNFHKKSKKPHLIKLGAGEILTPDEVI